MRFQSRYGVNLCSIYHRLGHLGRSLHGMEYPRLDANFETQGCTLRVKIYHEKIANHSLFVGDGREELEYPF